MQRSRIVQNLSVEEEFLGPSLAEALLEGLFEHRAGTFSYCVIREDHRSSSLPNIALPQPGSRV